MKKIIVRCKATGVYHIRSFGHGFITMDANQATRYNDTPELRAKFAGPDGYPFEVEFITV